MYFSLWTNSYPEQVSTLCRKNNVGFALMSFEQMPNNLVPIDVEGGEVGWSRGADVDQWSVVYANVVRSFDLLGPTCEVNEKLLARCHSQAPLHFRSGSTPSHTLSVSNNRATARVSLEGSLRFRHLPLLHLAHSIPISVLARSSTAVSQISFTQHAGTNRSPACDGPSLCQSGGL